MAPVIELWLQGGLGNQLFQWCAADRLCAALGSNAPLINANLYIADPYQRRPLLHTLFPNLALIQQPSSNLSQSTRLLRETDETRDLLADLTETRTYSTDLDRIIVDGYWQDSRIATSRQLEQIKTALKQRATSDLNAAIHRIGSSIFPVSVHIRRHDYAHHGVCNINYFIDACSAIRNIEPGCRFFIFSDEPNFSDWAFSKTDLKFSTETTGNPLHDLFLMSHCSAHVISNSTYSWWAARLSKAKLVVAPSPWSYIHTPSPNLIPPWWTVVDGAVIEPTLSKTYNIAVMHAQADRS